MKKCIRYFCGFLNAQEKWLNSMSEKGYRLVRTGKLIYEFEECKHNKYVYCVDFVAHKSNTELKAYKLFLEDIGYKVISKNANLNWSVGKIRLRPYGDGLGKIATSPGNYNKELLIVEKENDRKPFELHTTIEDKLSYYRIQRNAYLSLLLLSIFVFLFNGFGMTVLTIGSSILGVLALLVACPTILLQKKCNNLKKQLNLEE